MAPNTYIRFMANVIPFQAVRPSRNKVHLVASRAFYTYPKHILKAKLDSNVYSFIHIINPEFNSDQATEPNSIERFTLVKQKYEEFKQKAFLIKDDKPCYYIYEQAGVRTFCGFIAGASVADYNNNVIKKHEDTLTKREQTFKTYLDVCSFNAEPVLLTYPDHAELNKIMQRYKTERPEYEFCTTDEICHTLWKVSDPSDIKLIINAFDSISDLYIADGHHRSASSAILANQKQDSSNAYQQHFMSYLIPESNLQILDFNRLITDLNGLSKDQFLELLSEKFNLEVKSEPYKSERYNTFGLYLHGKWYKLQLKEVPSFKNSVDVLDPKILNDLILEPILKIQDQKTSDRIHFVGGPKGFNDMINLVDQGKFEVGFSLYPVSVQQLKTVADNNLTMPPKSTWIEPKLRSGLTIYEF